MFKISQKPSEIIDLSHYERKISSQNGEDGVIAKILETLGESNPYYVEIGVEDGRECNSRYLREELGYQGLQFDKDYENLEINLYREFITAENIKQSQREIIVIYYLCPVNKYLTEVVFQSAYYHYCNYCGAILCQNHPYQLLSSNAF